MLIPRAVFVKVLNGMQRYAGGGGGGGVMFGGALGPAGNADSVLYPPQ